MPRDLTEVREAISRWLVAKPEEDIRFVGFLLEQTHKHNFPFLLASPPGVNPMFLMIPRSLEERLVGGKHMMNPCKPAWVSLVAHTLLSSLLDDSFPPALIEQFLSARLAETLPEALNFRFPKAGPCTLLQVAPFFCVRALTLLMLCSLLVLAGNRCLLTRFGCC